MAKILDVKYRTQSIQNKISIYLFNTLNNMVIKIIILLKTQLIAKDFYNTYNDNRQITIIAFYPDMF